MKNILRRAWLIIGLVSLSLSCVVWYFSGRVLNPASPCVVEKVIHCETPKEMGLSYESVTLTTSDAVTLDGWFIPREGATKAVLFVHGHGGDIHEGLRYAPALHEAGYHLMPFSLRGNMPDGGMPYYSMGYHERKDVRAAVDYLLAREDVERVAVFGFSMGAVTAIGAMADDPRISAGIFNSPFRNVSTQLAYVAHRDYSIPYYPVIPMVVALSEWRTGSDFGEIASEDIVGKISPRPVFVMHGRGDRYVLVENGEAVFAAAKEPKQSWFSDSPSHVYEWNWKPAEAEKRVTEFLSQAF